MTETKVMIQLSMQSEQVQTIQLDFGTQIDLLLDYEAMAKKILQKFKFVASGKANIRLKITNFYKENKIEIPIFNPKNWTTLIGDMLERNIYKIQVIVVKSGQLRLKKQREKQVPVEFDSDGSIESVQDENVKNAIKINTPSCPPYKGPEIVRCHFCHHSNNTKQSSRAAGPFYGPFKGKLFAHLLCLLWCSDVFIQNQTFQFCGVEKAVDVSKKLLCNYCKQKGASFYCHKEACRKKAHFKCATQNGWFFNWGNYKAFCPDERMDPIQKSSASKTRTLTNRQSRKEQTVKYEQPEQQLQQVIDKKQF